MRLITPRDVPLAIVAPPRPLIDEFLPVYDVRSRHQTRVNARPQDVYAAIWRADLAYGLPVRLLLALRALPAAVIDAARRPRATVRRLRARASAPVTIREIREAGFRVLAEAPPRQLLIGREGRFWPPSGNPPGALDPERFLSPLAPGLARAAWTFEIVERADGASVLTTETRIHCADDATRRRFLAYWAVMRPWSGLVRRCMLRSIRREAEGA